mgnify:CR=1 FL=1
MSKYISRTIVSTDCEKTKEISLSFGAEVPFMRPNEISNDLPSNGRLPIFVFALSLYFEPELIFCIKSESFRFSCSDWSFKNVIFWSPK